MIEFSSLSKTLALKLLSLKEEATNTYVCKWAVLHNKTIIPKCIILPLHCLKWSFSHIFLRRSVQQATSLESSHFLKNDWQIILWLKFTARDLTSFTFCEKNSARKGYQISELLSRRRMFIWILKYFVSSEKSLRVCLLRSSSPSTDGCWGEHTLQVCMDYFWKEILVFFLDSSRGFTFWRQAKNGEPPHTNSLVFVPSGFEKGKQNVVCLNGKNRSSNSVIADRFSKLSKGGLSLIHLGCSKCFKSYIEIIL